VAFASQVTGGTAPWTYAWTLGDGSTSAAPSFGHVYARAGNYSVALNVTDGAGAMKTVAFVVDVHVVAVPHPASGSSGSVSLTSGTGLYLLLGLLILLVLVVVLAALLARRPRSPPGTLQPYPTTPSSSPTPPPGAAGPPPS
jgi:hypothetical protein